MKENYYEKYRTDSEMPAVLHTELLMSRDDTDAAAPETVAVHWHENLEIIYVLEGECEVVTNAVRIHIRTGDIAIINPNMVYKIETVTGCVKYNSLIVDKVFLRLLGIDIDNILFERHIRDKSVQELYLSVVQGFESSSKYRCLELKLALFTLALNLVKYHVEGEIAERHNYNQKTETVKKSIEYMKKHYAEPLNIDSLAKKMGFTKYYFCHIFNEVTGTTVINHLNYIRCKNAKSLILSGDCNISESAEKSGFTNMSYFAKVYKRFMGELPSETAAKIKK